MDIPADEYPAKRAAQTNATTTPQPWPWHLWSEYFLIEQYSVFTYTLIKTQRGSTHIIGLKKLK
jgi:hypothetical protein